MSKRVCILAPVHIYSDVRVFQKEAKSLVQATYEIFLVARHERECVEEGVHIIPLPKYNSRLQRFMLQWWLLCKTLSTKASIVHLHNPDTLLLGFVLKMLGKKVIYDTHEDFTKRILVRQWIPHYLRNIIATSVGILETVAGYFFDYMIATQEDVAERLGKKCVIIENAPIANGQIIDKAYENSMRIQKQDIFRVVYVGEVSRERGLMNMVNAMNELNKTVNSRLWLIGPIDDNEKDFDEAKKLDGWKYVDYLGFLPQHIAFSYMIAADVGLIITLNVGGYDKINPNKIFEYQRFGIPFIASDYESWKSQVLHTNSGLFVNTESEIKVAEALQHLAEHKEEAKIMGRNGQKFILENYNWEMESKKLLQIYNQLTSVQ